MMMSLMLSAVTGLRHPPTTTMCPPMCLSSNVPTVRCSAVAGLKLWSERSLAGVQSWTSGAELAAAMPEVMVAMGMAAVERSRTCVDATWTRRTLVLRCGRHLPSDPAHQGRVTQAEHRGESAGPRAHAQWRASASMRALGSDRSVGGGGVCHVAH